MRPSPFLPLLFLAVTSFAAAPADYDTTELKPYPWEPSMPRDFRKEPVTAADWVGPDGIIYPNWQWAGVHIGEPGARKAGIPKLEKVAVTIDEKLAGAENGAAFTKALAEAVETCGRDGGGVIQIPAGSYTLIRPLLIQHDRIVLRGAGRGKAVEPGGRDDPEETRILFNFAYGVEGEPPVKMLSFPGYEHIYKNSVLGFYAQAFSPKSSPESRLGGGKESHINRFEITVTPKDGKPFKIGLIKNWNMRDQFDVFEGFKPAGPTNVASIKAERLNSRLKDAGEATFETKVVWQWKEKVDGKPVEQVDEAVSPPVSMDCSNFGEPPEGFTYRGKAALTNAITFLGTDSGGRAYFTRDAKRGDTGIHVHLPTDKTPGDLGFVPGKAVMIWAYESDLWTAAIERDGGASAPRDFFATIASVELLPETEEVKVTIEQPLQIAFAKNEGFVDEYNQEKRGYTRTGTHTSWMKTVAMIQECGVENLVLEQTQHIWFSGIIADKALNCWVSNVRVERPGRDPINISGLMNEIRDSEVIDPIWANSTGGGTGYLHGSNSSLVENVYGRNLRHAPNFTGATGGVFHNCRFFSSDMQWHQNWGRAHLMDNVTVDALKGTGSYGWAAFGQRNIENIHGPGMGPRNTIYHCDLIGVEGGIFLGGKSENPLVLHNRVRAWSGPGLVLRYHIFNGIFLGNVFALQDRFSPAVLFGDPVLEKMRLATTKQNPKGKTHPKLGTANVGNDYILNTIYGGNGKLAEGPAPFRDAVPDFRIAYGNVFLPWQPEPPRPNPAMTSVFETQRANPEGFAGTETTDLLYDPARTAKAPAFEDRRNEGELVAKINFEDPRKNRRDDPLEWHGDEPGKGWASDNGEPVAEREVEGGTLKYGWINGNPKMYQSTIWANPDYRIRSTAGWGGDLNFDNVTPFGEWSGDAKLGEKSGLAWEIELDPGKYNVFLAAGDARKPERGESIKDGSPPPQQINDFLINGTALNDPRQSDLHLDAFWTTVEVGPDRKLTLRPAPTAITPRVNFIEIYEVAK